MIFCDKAFWVNSRHFKTLIHFIVASVSSPSHCRPSCALWMLIKTRDIEKDGNRVREGKNSFFLIFCWWHLWVYSCHHFNTLLTAHLLCVSNLKTILTTGMNENFVLFWASLREGWISKDYRTSSFFWSQNKILKVSLRLFWKKC